MLADASLEVEADVDRNASEWPGTQAEVSIAVDPSNPALRPRGDDEHLRREHPRDVFEGLRCHLDARFRSPRSGLYDRQRPYGRVRHARRRLPRESPGRAGGNLRRRRPLARRRPDLGPAGSHQQLGHGRQGGTRRRRLAGEPLPRPDPRRLEASARGRLRLPVHRPRRDVHGAAADRRRCGERPRSRGRRRRRPCTSASRTIRSARSA